MKNEARQSSDRPKNFLQEYTHGMTHDRLQQGWRSDKDRLQKLYKDAIGSPIDEITGEEIKLSQKFNRLATATLSRLNPIRRLAFGSSIIGFGLHYLGTGVVSQALLPLSFAGLVVLLLVELLEKLDAKKEIDLARQIQISLFPSPKIEKSGLEFSSFATTAQDVGGDYVDIIPCEGGTYCIIADVSGKGLSASLYMIRLQAMVHLLIRNDSPSPKQLLCELNNFIKSGKRDKTFVTACAAYFPKDADYFSFSRAGHNGPIYFSKANDTTTEILSPGFALGMTDSERLKKQIQEVKIEFQKGDSVLFYTDGLVEARNSFGQEFDTGRITSIMDVYGSLDAETITRKIQTSLESFIGNEKPLDDITFTCVHRS